MKTIYISQITDGTSHKIKALDQIRENGEAYIFYHGERVRVIADPAK